MKHKVISEWQSGMHFVTDTVGGHVILDSAIEHGGKGVGKSPKPLMLVSLAGCTGMDVVTFFEKLEIEVDDFKVEVFGELTETHPKIYNKVKINYYFSGFNEADKDRIEKVVNLSLNKYCGVYAMFEQFAEMSFEIIYNN